MIYWQSPIGTGKLSLWCAFPEMTAFPETRTGGHSLPVVPRHPTLASLAGILYQLQTVPIELGGDSVGALTVGTRFELGQYPLAGQAVLLEGNKVIRSTFPTEWSGSIQKQVQKRCSQPKLRMRNFRQGRDLRGFPITGVANRRWLSLARISLARSARCVNFAPAFCGYSWKWARRASFWRLVGYTADLPFGLATFASNWWRNCARAGEQGNYRHS